jgi:hypothetical protein
MVDKLTGQRPDYDGMKQMTLSNNFFISQLLKIKTNGAAKHVQEPRALMSIKRKKNLRQ